MIESVVIGRGNNRRVASLPCHHSKDVHRSMRADAAEMLKGYLFGPREPGNRIRNKAFKRGVNAIAGAN